jgi:hypothetical protein
LENFHELDDNLICEDCSEEFSIKNDYKEHWKKHENVCVPCGKTYKRHTDKIWHDQSVHQDPSLRTCIRCDRLFANAADLYKHHQKEHPRTRLVILCICSACNDFYFLLSFRDTSQLPKFNTENEDFQCLTIAIVFELIYSVVSIKRTGWSKSFI